MKFKFTIRGYATGDDEADIKMWLEESIMEYNTMPKVVDKFEVDVEEID
jgi:hypothetical protein